VIDDVAAEVVSDELVVDIHQPAAADGGMHARSCLQTQIRD
jgi:hypothetical protein